MLTIPMRLVILMSHKNEISKFQVKCIQVLVLSIHSQLFFFKTCLDMET